jgi:quinol monooxygenase YgiN
MKIIRLVKLSFKKDFLEQFLGELEKRKERIRNFEGCLFLEIWQDKKTARNYIYAQSLDFRDCTRQLQKISFF